MATKQEVLDLAGFFGVSPGSDILNATQSILLADLTPADIAQAMVDAVYGSDEAFVASIAVDVLGADHPALADAQTQLDLLLASNNTGGEIAVIALQFLQENTSDVFADAKALIANRATVAEFLADNGQTDLSLDALDSVDETDASVTAITNTAPALTGDAAANGAADEDNAVTVDAAALLTGYTDVDGDELSVVNVAVDGNSTLVDNGDGTYTITPDANYFGAVEVTYDVTDGEKSVAASWTIDFASVNDLPVAEAATAAAAEADTAVTGQLVASDVETAALTFALDAPVEGLTLNADGSYTFDATANTAAAALTYTSQPLDIVANYTVTDEDGGTASSTLTITVTPTPLTFSINASVNPVQEGEAVEYTLVASEAVQADFAGVIQVVPGDGTSGQTATGDFGSGSFNPQNVTITTGNTTSNVATITPANDAAAEVPESYTVTATVAGYEIADFNATVQDPAAVGGLGQTFTLTTGIDTVPGLVGSAGSTGTDGNDTIVATNTTLTALDAINGGAGSDTLQYASLINAPAIPASAVIQSVETFNLRSAAALGTAGVTAGTVAANPQNGQAVAGNTAAFDVSGYADVTTVNVTAAAGDVAVKASATADVNVSGVVNVAGAGIALATAVASNIEVDGGKDVVVTDTAANNNITVGSTVVGGVQTASATAAAGTITVTDSNQGAGVVQVDGGTNVSITNQGTGTGTVTVGALAQNSGTVAVSNTAAALANTAGANVAVMGAIAVTGGTTVNVTQSANAAGSTNVDNAGDIITQGAVTVTGGNNTTSVTVTGDDQSAAVIGAAAVAAVAQTQTVTFLGMLANETVTVNGLTFTAAKTLTAAEVAQAFSNLTAADLQSAGGPTTNGVFTGVDAGGFTTGAANGASVTYTETVAGANAGAIAVADTIAAGNVAAPTVVAGNAATAAATSAAGVASGAVVVADGGTASITDVVVDSYNTAAITGNALQNVTLKNSGVTGATVTTTQTALNLTLDDVDGAVNLDLGGASITNLTINTEGTASTAGAIAATLASTVTINAGANLTTAASTIGATAAATAVTVTGAGTVNLNNIGAANLTTINAATNTGGVTATATGVATQFTGGAGADNLTLVAATTAATTMGAGNDTVVMTTLGAGGTVDGGEGTADVLSTTVANAVNASASGVFDAAVTNFERLTITGVAGGATADNSVADTIAVNLANLTYDYVTVSGTGNGADATADTLALTGMAANGTINVTANGLYTVALADASGATDALNMVVTGAGLNAGTVTATGVETYNVSTAGTAVTAAGTLAANEGTAGVLTTINVSGAQGLTLTSNATAVTTVDASAMSGTTGLTYTANDGTTTVTGGAGVDTLTAAGNSDVLIGGAGNDILTGANLTTLTGGAGNDTFFMNMPTNVNSYSTITDLSSGDVIDFRPGVDAAAGTGTIVFQAAAVVLANTAVFQDYANAAVNSLGADVNDAAWFQYMGDTYIVQSGANHTVGNTPDFQNGVDSIIKITGSVDLSTASYNQDAGTLEIA